MDYNDKIDYSSLATYIDCPRKFLFQYVMHFRSARPNIHLVFGSCWHYGLEVVYKRLMKDPDSLTIYDATELARISFNDLWKLEGAPHWLDEDMIFPKSPGHAANMYHEYWKQYLRYDEEGKRIISVESPFIIDLSNFIPNLPAYIGRQDLIFEKEDGSLEIIDHKTAKSLWPTTLSGFEMSMQTDGYLAAGHMYYDKIPTMTYNMAICQKSKIAFHRYHIIKRKSAIEQFLQDIIAFSTNIIADLKIFQKEKDLCTARNDFIQCFRRSPGYACTAYMSSCPFMDICKMRNNPLLWHGRPPQGYTINEWDPETHEAEMKARLEEAS